MNIAITFVTALATWLIVRLVLKHYLQYRRKTQSGQEWQQYKAKLPAWVKQTEMVFWIILWLPLMLAFVVLLDMAYSAVHPALIRQDSIASGLILVSSAFTALVPAMMLGNVISWLLPPIRKANLAAMGEFATVSYRSATTGLVKFGSVLVPVSLAVAVLAVLAPWAN
jgi:hypothetical protein